MSKAELIQKANDAIARWNDPTLPKPSKNPVIQVWQDKKLPSDFPVSHEYLGIRRGKHVYNLSAYQLLEFCVDGQESK